MEDKQNPEIRTATITFDDGTKGTVSYAHYPGVDDLTGIATLSHDPLATYYLAGRKPTKHKGSRK